MKIGAVAKQTADCTALQSQMTFEPWNHGTMEPSNQKSQVDQEYGLLPADPRQQLEIRNRKNLARREGSAVRIKGNRPRENSYN